MSRATISSPEFLVSWDLWRGARSRNRAHSNTDAHREHDLIGGLRAQRRQPRPLNLGEQLAALAPCCSRWSRLGRIARTSLGPFRAELVAPERVPPQPCAGVLATSVCVATLRAEVRDAVPSTANCAGRQTLMSRRSVAAGSWTLAFFDPWSGASRPRVPLRFRDSG